MRTYFDFTADSAGALKLLHYSDPDATGRIPRDLSSALLGQPPPELVAGLVKELYESGFWETKRLPVASNIIRYMVLVSEDRKIHFLDWEEDEQPYPPAVHAVYEKIKSVMIDALLGVVK